MSEAGDLASTEGTLETLAPPGLVPLLGGLSASTRRLFAGRVAREAWVAELGLRPPSYGVLLGIERLGPTSQKRLSDQMGLDPSDLVAVIDILERGGLVSRARDPQDRRRYSLTLTALGRRRLRCFDAIAAEVEDELLAPLAEEERATFRRLVQRVLEHQRRDDASSAGD